MAKFCPKCGNALKPEAKFCTKCGHQMGTAPMSDIGKGAASGGQAPSFTPSVTPEKKSQKTSGNSTGKIVLIIAVIAVLALILVGILGFVVFKSGVLSRFGIGKKSDTTVEMQQEPQETEDIYSQKGNEVEEEEEEEGEFGVEVSDPTVRTELTGVSSSNMGDYNNCTSPDDYLIEHVNDAFSFGYPNNFFSSVEIEGNTYKFETSDGSTRMTVCQEEAVSSDAVENCKYYHNKELANIDTSSEVSGVNNLSDYAKDGWAHSLIGGNLNSSNESIYRIVVSNGADVYSLNFVYTNQEPDNYYTAQMYMIDCIYRLCEHSGSTYYVRNYLQFLDDVMGTKK